MVSELCLSFPGQAFWIERQADRWFLRNTDWTDSDGSAMYGSNRSNAWIGQSRRFGYIDAPNSNQCFHSFHAISPLKANIVLLPGDGIGPEITAQAARVLETVAQRFGHQFDFRSHMIGGISIDTCGDPLPQETIDACRTSDAILLGAVGGPKWDDPSAKTRPEAGLLKIRKELGLFANLRPIRLFEQLVDASPLKREIIEGTDILFLRELTGGIYFGESGRTGSGSQESAYQTMVYSVFEVERIVRMAAKAARDRRNHLTSVDKANVLEPSRLWRSVAARVMKEEFPDVRLRCGVGRFDGHALDQSTTRLRCGGNRQHVRGHPDG